MSLHPPSPLPATNDFTSNKATRVVASLFISFELFGLLLLYFIYHLPNMAFSLFTLALCGLVVAGLGVSVVVALTRYASKLTAESYRQVILTIAMNVITAIFIIASGEGALRILHEISMRQPTWASTTPIFRNWERLFPKLRSWERTSNSFLAVIDNRNPDPPYHAYDPTLGWTVAKSRRSKDGLYASSREGLRSLLPDEQLLPLSLPTPESGHLSLKPSRIALLGDSYTFGWGVAYQESWAHLFGLQMKPDFITLNYGVIGYSVNQARLRYEQEARQAHPHIVILSVISHDFLRDTFIYNFMPYPDFLTLPYARPRPVLRNGELSLLNTPLIEPKNIFTTPDVHQLPHLDYDSNYNPVEWERNPWRTLQRSFLFRLLTSRSSRLPITQQQVYHQEAQALGVAVLKTFVASVRADGAIPILVYFPDQYEVDSTITPPTNHLLLAPKIMQAANLTYIDTTPCIITVAPPRRFSPDNHFTVESNAAISACLPDLIRQQIAREKSTTRTYNPHAGKF